MSRLKQQLLRHEGERLLPYRDSEGVLTIGVGHNLERGISQEVSRFMFNEDVKQATDDLIRAHPVVIYLDDVRRDALINMTFNLGLSRLAGFRKMWAAIGNMDFNEAAKEMLDSLWHRQVGSRAEELAEQMKTGEYQV